jgi:hypothetical protein
MKKNSKTTNKRKFKDDKRHEKEKNKKKYLPCGNTTERNSLP